MKGWKKRNSGDPPTPAPGPQLPSLAEGDGRVDECVQVDRNPPHQFPESEEYHLQRKNFHRKPADSDGDVAAAAADEEQEDDEDDVDDDDKGDEDYTNNFQLDGEAGAGDGDVDGEEMGDPERPKLAEGFYEIESVRRKRVRKGQVQYLIKWRGWPETENTWEPVENLMSVYDVIDSFEESLRSGKRSLRKRKRKHGSTPTQIKKKQHLSSPTSASFSVPDVKVRIIEEPLSFTSHDDIGVANHSGANVDGVNHVVTRNGNSMNGDLISPRTEGREDQNDLDTKLSELKGATANSEENHVDKFAVHSQEAKVSGQVTAENGSAHTDCAEMFQSGRCTGARRRKSGSVKRFKQEATLCKSDDPDIMTLNSVTSGLGGNQVNQHSDFSNEFGYRNKTDNPKDICNITEIIRPISYSSSTANNMPDVTVTFMAKRSDGKEVTVDNKFLKSNNPLLLINFYEQNLRYTPA